MGLPDILITDLDSNSCSVDHCGQIVGKLPKMLPDSEFVIQSGLNALSETNTTFSPDIILLKSSLAKRFNKAVQILKRRWRACSVLGIFCNNTDEPAALCQAVADDLADFLFCPFEENELLLRIQRFLQSNGKNTADLTDMQLKAPPRYEGLVGENKSFLQMLKNKKILGSMFNL